MPQAGPAGLTGLLEARQRGWWGGSQRAHLWERAAPGGGRESRAGRAGQGGPAVLRAPAPAGTTGLTVGPSPTAPVSPESGEGESIIKQTTAADVKMKYRFSPRAFQLTNQAPSPGDSQRIPAPMTE